VENTFVLQTFIDNWIFYTQQGLAQRVLESGDALSVTMRYLFDA